MKRIHPVFIVPVAVIVFCSAWFLKPDSTPPQQLQPVALDDMRAIVTALEPFENGRSWDRAQVCVRSRPRDQYGPQSTVNIEFHPTSEAKLAGSGNDIGSAVMSLNAGGVAVQNALMPFVRVTK